MFSSSEIVSWKKIVIKRLRNFMLYLPHSLAGINFCMGKANINDSGTELT